MGLESLQKIEETVLKYPQYFKKEEVGYFKADDATHRKYRKKLRKLEKEYFPERFEKTDFGNKGIFHWVREQKATPFNINKEDLSKVLEEWLRKEDRRKEFEKKKEILFKKIYL